MPRYSFYKKEFKRRQTASSEKLRSDLGRLNSKFNVELEQLKADYSQMLDEEEDFEAEELQEDLGLFSNIFQSSGASEEGYQWVVSSVVLVNIMLEVSFMDLPVVYREAGGIINGIISTFLAMIFTIPGFIMIICCSKAAGTTSYQDTIRYFAGDCGRALTDIVMFVCNFTVCSLMLILLGDMTESVSLYIYGEEFCNYWYLNRLILLPFMAAIFIFPYIYPEKIDSFKTASIIGFICSLYVIVMIVFEYFYWDPGDRPKKPLDNEESGRVEIIIVLSPIIHFFHGHIAVVVIFSALSKQTVKTLMKCLITALVVTYVLDTLCGVFGFLTFGEKLKADVLACYQPPNVFVLFAYFMIATKAILTYPAIFFFLRQTVELSVLHSCNLCGYALVNRDSLRISTSFTLFTLTLIVALLLPNIGCASRLVGAITAATIFILPSWCYLQLMKDEGNIRWNDWKYICVLYYQVLGIFILIIAMSSVVFAFSDREEMRREVQCIIVGSNFTNSPIVRYNEFLGSTDIPDDKR